MAVCGGLVTTATTILLVIFIPKVGEGWKSWKNSFKTNLSILIKKF